MIRRLLAWLCPAPELDARFAAYRSIPTGLRGEAEARRRRMPAFVADSSRVKVVVCRLEDLPPPFARQIGPHPLTGEAVGGSSAADVRRGGGSLSPVLTRPEPFSDVQRVADFGVGVWR